MKRFFLQILVALAFVSANATTITKSTDASSVANFGTQQTVFSGTGITLTVSNNITGHSFKGATANSENTLKILSGATLKTNVTGSSSNPAYNFKDCLLNITGDGKINSTINKEVFFGGSFVIETPMEFKSGTALFKGNSSRGLLVIDVKDYLFTVGNKEAGWYTTAFSGSDNTDFHIKSGVVEMGNYAQWGINTTCVIDKGATLNTNWTRTVRTSGGVAATNLTQEMTVNGTLTMRSSGSTGSGGKNATLFASRLTVGPEGKVLHLPSNEGSSVEASYTVIACELTNAGEIDLFTPLYMSNNSVLNLKAGSTIRTEQASSYAETYIQIVDILSLYGSRPIIADPYGTSVEKANVTVNVEGQHEIGGFNMYKDSVLKINFQNNGYLHTSLTSISGADPFTVEISGEWKTRNFRLKSMNEDLIQAITWKSNGKVLKRGIDYELEPIFDTKGEDIYFNKIGSKEFHTCYISADKTSLAKTEKFAITTEADVAPLKYELYIKRLGEDDKDAKLVAAQTENYFEEVGSDNQEGTFIYYVVADFGNDNEIRSNDISVTFNNTILVLKDIPTEAYAVDGGSYAWNYEIDELESVTVSLTYQWQVSTDNGNSWNDIPKEDSSKFILKKINAEKMANNLYRCVVKNGIDTKISNSSKLVMKKPAQISTQPDAQLGTFAVGEEMEFSVAAEGDDLAYQWEMYNESEKDWVAITDANESTLTIVSEKAGNVQYRCIVSNSCSSDISDVVKVSVIAEPDVEIDKKKHKPEAFPNNSATLAVKATGKGGKFQYQWYKIIESDKEGIPVEENGNKPVFETPLLLESDLNKQLYYCKVSIVVKGDNGYEEVVSKDSDRFVIQKLEPAEITVVPTSAQVYEKTTKEFVVEVNNTSGRDVSYQWQVSSDEGNTWKNISGKDNKLTLKNVSTKLDGNWYRCKVWNDGNKDNPDIAPADGEAPVVLTVLANPKIQTQSSAQTVGVGTPMELSVTASGGGVLSYQWQVYNESSKNWEEIKGATETTYKVEEISDGNKQYRCVVSNGSQTTATTKTIKVSVISKPTVVVDEKKHKPEAFLNNTATLAVKATCNGGKLQYQWYKKNPDCVEEIIEGANKAVCQTPVLSEEDFKCLFFCRVSAWVKAEEMSSKDSEMFTITKLESAIVDVHPVSQEVIEKDTVEFSVQINETAGDDVSYQWYVSSDNELSWKNVSGKANKLTLKKVSSKLSGNKYRCEVWNNGNEENPAKSTAALLIVKAPPVVKTSPKSVKTFETKNATFKVIVQSPEGVAVKYKWQVLDARGNWEELTDEEGVVQGSDTDTLTVLASDSTTKQYRCMVWGDDPVLQGTKVYSKVAKHTVDAKAEFKNKDISVMQGKVVLEYTDGECIVFEDYQLELSVSCTGKSIKYQWKESSDGDLWTNVSGGTKAKLSIKPALLDDKMYKCIVYNGTPDLTDDNGTHEESNVLIITVKESPLLVSLAGQGFDITCKKNGKSIQGSILAITQDGKVLSMTSVDKMVTNNERYTVSKCSYKRTSPITANVTLDLTKVVDDNYEDVSEKLKLTGTLMGEYDDENVPFVSGELTDSSGSIWQVDIDVAQTYEPSLNMGDKIILEEQDSTQSSLPFYKYGEIDLTDASSCEVNYGTENGIVATYKYQYKSGGVAVLSVSYKKGSANITIELTMLFDNTSSSGRYVRKTIVDKVVEQIRYGEFNITE